MTSIQKCSDSFENLSSFEKSLAVSVEFTGTSWLLEEST